MNSFSSSRSVKCAAIALAAGLASSAWAVDRSWTCGGGSWTTDGCWLPLGRPGNTDVARFGNRPGVQNVIVHLDANEIIAGLHIMDGMTFDIDNFTLDVNGDITITGRNTVGDNVYISRLRIDGAVDGPEVTANNLTISDEAVLTLNGGGVLISDTMSLVTGTAIEGVGTIQFSGSGTTFVNNGEIIPAPSGITFQQTGNGRYDLDGTLGNGHLNLGTIFAHTLSFQGVGLSDAFSGTAVMVSNATIHTNLTEGWTADEGSEFSVHTAPGGGAARITGSEFTFGGSMELTSSAHLRVLSPFVLDTTADVALGNQSLAEFTANTVIEGGAMTLAQNADVDFEGDTIIRGGTFSTFSELSSQGVVDFMGDTVWDGDVVINGIARQFGEATVARATVIDIDTFDMDGNGSTVWNLDGGLILNAGRIDVGTSDFSGTLNISAGLFTRITVNLDDADEAWTMSGTMNLSGLTAVFGTRVGDGSPLIVTGDVNVTGGRVDIATPTTLTDSANISINAATGFLRFMSTSEIDSAATFTGGGILQNGGAGDMTLMSGLVTGAVGLNNTGTLRIGDGPGIVSVDRFQNSGTWAVQIGGDAAGSEYDRLVSNGVATLGGELSVELLGSFAPAVGDSFTILSAVGGVSGAFEPAVTSAVGNVTYHWNVMVGANDVVLQLASIQTPCDADFNADGVVNSQDFFDFLSAFFVVSADADFNEDGLINSQDFFDFLTAFFTVCH